MALYRMEERFWSMIRKWNLLFLGCSIILSSVVVDGSGTGTIATNARPERSSSSSKILLVSNQFNSHIMELHHIGSELTRRGHHVFSLLDPRLTSIVDSAPDFGITPILVNVPSEFVDIRDLETEAINIIFDGKAFDHAIIASQFSNDMCDVILHDNELLSTLRSHDFDLAIVDRFVLCQCLYLLPHNLSIPYMGSGSVPSHPWMMRTPALPSFVPVILEEFSDKMSLPQRIKNAVMHFLLASMGPPVPGVSNTSLLDTFAPGLTWNDLDDNSLFHVILRDHLLEWPVPTMPNVLYVPGITAKPPAPLPPEFQKIVEGATTVVLMSFGSLLGQIPIDSLVKFLNTFSQIDATVIGRYNGDMENISEYLPGNVHLFKWLPQNDLLGHPKTRLFLTHCGNNGQYEAIYHGVPMIGFPLFGDQQHNCFRVVQHEVGLQLDIRDFTPRQLLETINEVMSNPMYADRAQLKSEIMKDMPQTPKEMVGHWIDHVIQYGGAHLRSRALDVPWYQYLMLDIVAVCALCLIVVSYLFIKVINLGISQLT